jgi:uncharacterized protein (DUF1800 family)
LYFDYLLLTMSSINAFIAANRFGYGANAKTIAHIGASPQQWLLGQVNAATVASEILALEPRWSSKQALESLAAYKLQKKADESASSMNVMQQVSGVSRKGITESVEGAVAQTIHQAIVSENAFLWRLVDFFSNHFSVSVGNLNVRALAPTMEIEAIAAHLAGSFSEMLEAVETHPTMLHYLNNVYSIGPNSKNAKKSKDGKGLNENLAREILELHTLGVNGGYLQVDVTELAKAITGWGIGSVRTQGLSGFKFRKNAHEPGHRLVLNKTYSQHDDSQGKAILLDLANHPSTANFVSSKLVRHFIADEPPQQIVDEMVKVWMSSKGHLPSVLKVMIQHPLSWKQQAEKFKTPREFVISTCRSCGIESIRPDFIRSLTLLGQAPFSAGSPAGYKDTQDYWAGPRAVMARIEWAEHVSKFVKQAPLVIAKNALGLILRPNTALQIGRAESRQQGLTLLLMSPEFQKR